MFPAHISNSVMVQSSLHGYVNDNGLIVIHVSSKLEYRIGVPKSATLISTIFDKPFMPTMTVRTHNTDIFVSILGGEQNIAAILPRLVMEYHAIAPVIDAPVASSTEQRMDAAESSTNSDVAAPQQDVGIPIEVKPSDDLWQAQAQELALAMKMSADPLPVGPGEWQGMEPVPSLPQRQFSSGQVSSEEPLAVEELTDDNVVKKVLEYIVEKSDGMFILTGLQLCIEARGQKFRLGVSKSKGCFSVGVTIEKIKTAPLKEYILSALKNRNPLEIEMISPLRVKEIKQLLDTIEADGDLHARGYLLRELTSALAFLHVQMGTLTLNSKRHIIKQ
jgi:hypothetical protein